MVADARHVSDLISLSSFNKEIPLDFVSVDRFDILNDDESSEGFDKRSFLICEISFTGVGNV